jgi:hypothetical protein
VVGVFAAAALQFGAAPAGADAAGFALVTAGTGAALIALLYWPTLAYLRRRSPTLSATRAAIVVALGLNAPVYAALLILGRDRQLFAGDEVVPLMVGVALIGALFAAGYARTHPPPAI